MSSARRGLDLRLETQLTRIDKQADGSLSLTLGDGSRLETDLVMFATGRHAQLEGLGLENTPRRTRRTRFHSRPTRTT